MDRNKVHKAVVAGLAFVMLMVIPPGVADHELESTYVTAGPVVGVLTCPFGPDGAACLGGGWFNPQDYPQEPFHTRPIQLTVSDFSGSDVDFMACQAWGDGTPLCGEQPNEHGEYEPRVKKCGTSADLRAGPDTNVPAGAEHEDGESVGQSFSSHERTSVYIRAWSPECPDSLATAGTITLKFGCEYGDEPDAPPGACDWYNW